ncbi:MAG TPA: ribose 5-phosphate isomerase B [Candidatus Kapabacteria bacterium]|jgi:ribose 5-phosphate isomerase B|nr:ribose 5-phosphate isomerase B [Candidatus Kapabacteria bacterium]
MARIALAADHGGVEYKDRIVEMLREAGHDVVDFGPSNGDACDYPDYAHPAAEAVAHGEAERAIIVCGSGIGVSIVANKSEGVRAANCTSVEMARLAREHNAANVLTIGERLVDWPTAQQIVETFLSTDSSSDERHRRRVDKIHALTGR